MARGTHEKVLEGMTKRDKDIQSKIGALPAAGQDVLSAIEMGSSERARVAMTALEANHEAKPLNRFASKRDQLLWRPLRS